MKKQALRDCLLFPSGSFLFLFGLKFCDFTAKYTMKSVYKYALMFAKKQVFCAHFLLKLWIFTPVIHIYPSS
ncbi:hypothetical protein CSA80_03830 [Candidatus Saccharibacteria bacterium]|nr:MAG: hypothetical protein CSA80_03830 [Candidatus Saccharibacteria bacterium]